MSHQEPVANFVEPQERNHCTLFGKTRKDGQAVLPVRFVVEEPLDREGGVQH
jgi:hypothetical protein